MYITCSPLIKEHRNIQHPKDTVCTLRGFPVPLFSKTDFQTSWRKSMTQRQTQFRDEKRENKADVSSVIHVWCMVVDTLQCFFCVFFQPGNVSPLVLEIFFTGAQLWCRNLRFVFVQWMMGSTPKPVMLKRKPFRVYYCRYKHLGYSFWIYEASKDSKNCRHADVGPLILYRNTSFPGLVWLRFLWTPWHCCSYGVFCHKCVIMRTAISGFWLEIFTLIPQVPMFKEEHATVAKLSALGIAMQVRCGYTPGFPIPPGK